jgi:hypothetical protein
LWTDLVGEICDLFNAFQSEEVSTNSFREPSLFYNNPEEVDEQDWQVNALITKPLGECDAFPLTCNRVMVYGRRWKNQYAEGEFTEVSVTPASSWGQQDYARMSEEKNPYQYLWDMDTSIPIPSKYEPDEEPEEEKVVIPEKSVTVRIQITLKSKGNNIRGSSDNFMIHNTSGAKIVKILSPMSVRYPKECHPSFSVRVQIQELVDGRYVGGGNFQFHNAIVWKVASEIRELLEENFLYSPKCTHEMYNPDAKSIVQAMLLESLMVH